MRGQRDIPAAGDKAGGNFPGNPVFPGNQPEAGSSADNPEAPGTSPGLRGIPAEPDNSADTPADTSRGLPGIPGVADSTADTSGIPPRRGSPESSFLTHFPPSYR